MEVEDEDSRALSNNARGDESNIKPEAGEAGDRLPPPLWASTLCRQRAPCPVNLIALLLTPVDGLCDIREQREEPARRPVSHCNELVMAPPAQDSTPRNQQRI